VEFALRIVESEQGQSVKCNKRRSSGSIRDGIAILLCKRFTAAGG